MVVVVMCRHLLAAFNRLRSSSWQGRAYSAFETPLPCWDAKEAYSSLFNRTMSKWLDSWAYRAPVSSRLAVSRGQ